MYTLINNYKLKVTKVYHINSHNQIYCNRISFNHNLNKLIVNEFNRIREDYCID